VAIIARDEGSGTRQDDLNVAHIWSEIAEFKDDCEVVRHLIRVILISRFCASTGESASRDWSLSWTKIEIGLNSCPVNVSSS
jgi:hypothetical protein